MVSFSEQPRRRPAKSRARLRMPIRIVLWREDRRWYAMCLEFGVMGDGRSQAAALRMLSDAIVTTADFCFAHNSLDSLFQPAKPEYFEMFAAGEDTAEGEIELHLDRLTLEQPIFRKYTGSKARPLAKSHA